jgi:hypothetical protein
MNVIMRPLLLPLLACLCLLLTACGEGENIGAPGNTPPPPFPSSTPAPTESSERDPIVRSILTQNEVVQAMLTGRQEGRDYWLRIDYVDRYREAPTEGDKPIAMINIYFDPPISYSGEVPTESDPCRGHYNDDDLDPNDPCMKQTPEYGTAHREFIEAACVTAQVELRRMEVVELFQSSVTPDEMQDIKARYGQ